MLDMLSPTDITAITLRDFSTPEKRKAGGILFDVLFNLNKFLRFEMRDPFQEKLRREDGFLCEWDRFAHGEYHRLAAEEENGSSQQQQQQQRQQQYQYHNYVDVSDIRSEEVDDYNMFSEDDSDAGDGAHNENATMMDIDNAGDRGSQGFRKGGSAVSGNFGDWSLDDESDSDDDYQISTKSGDESRSSMQQRTSNRSGSSNSGRQNTQKSTSSAGRTRKGK